MKGNITKTILLGSAWGITEATAGYLLHRFGMGFGWLLWFPIAFFFIHRAYVWTKSAPAVMLCAAIASSLKLVNLLFPIRPDRVFNPAVSIILEAAAVLLVYRLIRDGSEERPHFFHILLCSFTFRTFYLGYVHLLPNIYFELSPGADIAVFTRFMFLENAANTLLISAGFLLAERFNRMNLGRLYNLAQRLNSRSRLLAPAASAAALALGVLVGILTV